AVVGEDVLSPTRVAGPGVVDADLRGEAIGEALVVRGAQPRPGGQHARAVGLAEAIAVACEQRGGLVVTRKERPAVERVPPRDRAAPPRTHRSRERTRGEAGPGNEPDERTERVDTRCAEEMQAGHGRFESVIEHRGAFRAPDVREQARREEPIAVDVYPVPR